MNNFAVTTSCSNEGKYLEEFVAWNSLLGASKIYIFEHNNAQTPEFLTIKARLLSLGNLVEFHLAERTGTNDDIQMDNFETARDLAHDANITWLLTSDLDERVVLRRHSNLIDLLDTVPLSISQIFFQWKLFGSSERLEYEPALNEFEKYQSHAVNNMHNLFGKGLVRVKDVVKMHLHLHAVKGITVNGDLKPATAVGAHQLDSHYDLAGFIFHAAVRSKAEYQEKVDRGYASEWHKAIDPELYWSRRNLNDQAMPELSKLGAVVKARLDNWKLGAKQLEIGEGLNIENGRKPKVNVKSLVPKEILNWRAKAVLEAVGLLDDVDTALALLPAESRPTVMRAWNAASLARDGATVQYIATVLNLSEDLVDDLFIKANQLEV